MKKACINKGLTRQKLANPFQNEPMQDRLKKIGAVDLRDNFTITKLDNGYDRIEPIDANKKF